MIKDFFGRAAPYVSILFVVAGLTLVAVGVAMIYSPAGVIVGGVAFFALEWYVTDRK